MTTKEATVGTYTDAEYARDTQRHIDLVQLFAQRFCQELTERAEVHDASKFEEPERSVFREGTPYRDRVPYGGEAYRQHMQSVQVALNHHYAHNRHHPEFHTKGIQDMDLLDIVEMFCDWMSAAMKVEKGDPDRVRQVIALNQERFGYSDDLRHVLHNTVERLRTHKEAES